MRKSRFPENLSDGQTDGWTYKQYYKSSFATNKQGYLDSWLGDRGGKKNNRLNPSKDFYEGF